MSQLFQAPVIGHHQVAPGVFAIEFLAPEVGREAQPGQFLHIRCGEGLDPLLRRPISIHAVDRQSGLVKIMFQVVGRGTALLAGRTKGVIDLMGPLGRGFSIDRENIDTGGGGKNILVVGGGIGAAPLYFLLQELAVRSLTPRVKVLLGARNSRQLFALNEAKNLGFEVLVATDDGSAGHHGLVTDLMAEEMGSAAYVYACGPAPMLKSLKNHLTIAGVPGQVSVEERMACGVGACLSCVCRVRDDLGKEAYRHVCVDGPVFPAEEVVL